MVSMSDCLEEINHALNYWYPMYHTKILEEDECQARQSLFEFRDRLERQIERQIKAQL